MSFFARIRRSEPDLAFCAIVATVLAALVFVLQGHVGFGMQDESFLWYGVQRTFDGELPLRDFRAYDPGRYFWCAAWAALFGDGIVAVRASSWIFAAIGLTCGLLAARRAVASRGWLILVGVLLVVWMHPPWKLFESSLAMIAVLFATRLVERPSRARHVVAGVCVGLTAFFGRNFGLYTGLAFGLIMLYVAWKERARDVLTRIGALALGVALGYSPMLALCAFAPGFATAYVESVTFYLGQNALNAELPVPWPWRATYAGRGAAAAVSVFCVGAFFVLLVAFYLGALVTIVRAKHAELARRAPLIASVFVGGFIAHHAAVRSDLSHLAQSLHPLLIGMIALPAALGWTRFKFATCIVLACLLVASGFAVVPSMPFVQRVTADEPYVEAPIGSDRIYVAPNDARSVEGLRALVTARVRPDQTLWVGAHFIGLYPILGRRSPVWDIYPAWKANDALQQRMLEELARVDWVLLLDRPIGGDPNMILPVSHPRVFERLTQDFERVKIPGAPDSLFLLGRKGAR